MHIWLVEYSNTSLEVFSSKIDKINIQSDLPLFFSNGKIKFFSSIFHHEINVLNNISFDEDSLRGFSGLVIDGSGKKRDFRNIKNIPLLKELDFNELSGQFSIFEISEGNFKCEIDDIGHHKVFYFSNNEKNLVSNNLELLLKFLEKVHLDFKLETNYLDFYGYKTKFNDIYFLGTFQSLEIKNGAIDIKEKRKLSEIYNPDFDFEQTLEIYFKELKNVSDYLTKYHRVFIDVSGGFDSRVVLSMFYGKNSSNINLFTYNRQSNLDFLIAKKLNESYNFNHFLIKLKLSDLEKHLDKVDLNDSKLDPFKFFLYKESKDYCLKNEIPVKLNGNGGGTDWAFQFLSAFKSKSNTNKLGTSKELLHNHIDLLVKKNKNMGERKSIDKYFENKFFSIFKSTSANQKIASAIHLEHVIYHQGFLQSQLNPPYFYTYSPFASKNFFQLIFSSNLNQLKRGSKESIHYRLYDELTNGNKPYAPILRENNWYDMPMQKIENFIFPIFAKVLWKIQGGDFNTQIRKRFRNK
jgi:hypothetical protein